MAHEDKSTEMDKNDHRVIGKELGLFTFSDTVGKGLPLYTDKGATIRRELERFVVDEEIKRGYKHVSTPDIAKLDLYKKSGHYPYYKDTMYAPIDIDGEEFMLRPMTCPHHYELYLSKPHSYRELPMRIAEMAKLYRYEASGNLSGLVRVRSFCLADAHIICADNAQAQSEVKRALELITYVAEVFGLKKGEDFSYRLSLGDRDNDKKYFKDDKAWTDAEEVLREVLKNQDVKFVEAKDEAAFYGPKIDVQMKDVRGIENTAFTVQYDFLAPGRFELSFVDKDGETKLCKAVIHRSSIGAIERIMAFLIEHYRGSFPLWLSPVQVKVIPVREQHNAKAEEIFAALNQAGIRAEVDTEDANLGTKVRDAKTNKIPYWIVLGDKEVESGKLTLESRDQGPLGQLPIEEVLNKLQAEIKDKK
jgi:threonyl-tRNA synthetase